MEREEPLRSWVRLYSERLVRVACIYVKDQSTAEDRVQNAFIKAYDSMHHLQDADNPLPWLYRIVVNECKSYLKRSFRDVVTSMIRDQNEVSAEEIYFRQSEANRVRNAVLSLPEKYRLPIALFYFEEWKIHEIANLLTMPIDTVKSRLFRGRKRLEKSLEEEEESEPRREVANSETI